MVSKGKLVMLAAAGLLVAATVLAGPAVLSNTAQAAPGVPGIGRGSDTAKPGVGADSYLADALGITTEQLAAAIEKARLAAIDQALSKGLITQAQADALRNNERFSKRGGTNMFFRDSEIDHQALLAQALGVTVEKLEQAHKTAYAARLAQAVTDGKLTQEQVDNMKARQSLHEYMLEKDYFGTVLQQAVKDGVLTQAQADAILSQSKAKPGFGMPMFGKGGHGGMRGGMRGGR